MSSFLPLGVVLVFGLVGLVFSALWIWSLVDALVIPDQRWIAAGQSKLLWVLLIVFLGLLGSLLYVVMPRPELRRATS
jgi:Phospholipase_D-nuclease N-terminal